MASPPVKASGSVNRLIVWLSRKGWGRRWPRGLVLLGPAGLWLFLLLVAFVLPLWTSSLLRAYAWTTILRSTGVLNTMLGFFHLPSQQWLHSPVAVLIGLTYSFLPYMVLILYAALEKLDTRLLEASADLGATPQQTFWKITVPQTLPGIAAGCLLAFVLSMDDLLISSFTAGGGANPFIAH